MTNSVNYKEGISIPPSDFFLCVCINKNKSRQCARTGKSLEKDHILEVKLHLNPSTAHRVSLEVESKCLHGAGDSCSTLLNVMRAAERSL